MYTSTPNKDAETIVDSELMKLDRLHRRATSVLFTCHAVFPFDLFPNSLIIDHNKIDIIYRQFFKVRQVVSLSLSHINYVTVESSFFFSTLKIETKGLEQNPPPLHYLHNKDAIFSQHLLFGLISAEKNGISLSHLSKDKIIDKLIQIGQAV